jgi:hypothetical protein
MNDQTPRVGPPPSAGPPPATGGPAPYQVVSGDQRAIWRSKGQRYIGFGIAWLALGIIITVVTYTQAQAGGVYIVAWGPALYGAYRIIRGIMLLRQAG